MITGRLEIRTSEDINVKALSGCEWRVTDRRIARDNGHVPPGGVIHRHRAGQLI